MFALSRIGMILYAFVGVEAFSWGSVPLATHLPTSVKHVFIVVLENENVDFAYQQPFLNALSEKGAYLSAYRAITHPSQPNYIAMIAGSQMGVYTDGNAKLKGKHLGNLLEDKGLTWKVYAEAYPGGPGNCFTGKKSGRYVKKHVPFLSFKNVYKNSKRCDNIVNADQLHQDVLIGNLPSYAMYVPELDNDGHDTDVTYADRWLSQTFGGYLNDPLFMEGTLFIVTFDEARLWSFSNRIYTVFYGPMVKPGAVSGETYDHYDLLRTIEELFGLGTLNRNDKKARVIEDIWLG